MSQSKRDKEVAQRSLHLNFGSVARQPPGSQSHREPVVSPQKASGQAEAHKS